MRSWLERRFDGLVGRTIDYLGNPRPSGRPKVRRARTSLEDTPPEAEKVDQVARFVDAPQAQTPPEPPAQQVVETSTPGEDDPVRAALVEALAGFPDRSAAMVDLVHATGATRGVLRGRLAHLIAEGRVRRIGAGLKTRYQLRRPQES